MAITIQRVAAGLWLAQVDTEAGTATYDFNAIQTPSRVIWAQCVQIAAGGAADTAILRKRARTSATVTDISDACDCNKTDKTVTDFATYDDAQTDLDNGDNLRVVTASGATVRVTVLLAEIQATP